MDHRLARTPGFETPWLSLWAGSLWAPQSPSAKRGRHRCPPHGAVVTGQCMAPGRARGQRLALSGQDKAKSGGCSCAARWGRVRLSLSP